MKNLFKPLVVFVLALLAVSVDAQPTNLPTAANGVVAISVDTNGIVHGPATNMLINFGSHHVVIPGITDGSGTPIATNVALARLSLNDGGGLTNITAQNVSATVLTNAVTNFPAASVPDSALASTFLKSVPAQTNSLLNNIGIGRTDGIGTVPMATNDATGQPLNLSLTNGTATVTGGLLGTLIINANRTFTFVVSNTAANQAILGSAVTNTQTGVVLSGTFLGNGNGLSINGTNITGTLTNGTSGNAATATTATLAIVAVTSTNLAPGGLLPSYIATNGMPSDFTFGRGLTVLHAANFWPQTVNDYALSLWMTNPASTANALQVLNSAQTKMSGINYLSVFFGDAGGLTNVPGTSVVGPVGYANNSQVGTNAFFAGTATNVPATGVTAGTFIVGVLIPGNQVTGPVSYANNAQVGTNAFFAGSSTNSLTATNDATGQPLSLSLTNAVGGGLTNGSGVIVSGRQFAFGTNITALNVGTLTATNINGNGGGLTNLPGASLAGPVGYATNSQVGTNAFFAGTSTNSMVSTNLVSNSSITNPTIVIPAANVSVFVTGTNLGGAELVVTNANGNAWSGLTAQANNGTGATNFAGVYMANSGFAPSANGVGSANDGSLEYNGSGNLYISRTGPTTSHLYFVQQATTNTPPTTNIDAGNNYVSFPGMTLYANGSGLTNVNAQSVNGLLTNSITGNASTATIATNLAKLFRIATTGGRTMDGNAGGNTTIQIRYPVTAKDNLTGPIGVAIANFKIGNGLEQGIGGDALVKAAIEYPAGTYWQLRFSTNGAATNGVFSTPEATVSNYLARSSAGLTYTNIVVANGSWTIGMTNLPITITNGTTMWIRLWCSNSAGIIYTSVGTGQPIQSEYGNSVADKTMGQSTISGDAGAEFFPLAVFGYTANPSVAIFGDSIAFGLAEDQPQDDRISSMSVGFSRLVEPRYACANLSSPGEGASGFISTDGTNRLQICEYATAAWLALGHNDSGNCSNNVQNAAIYLANNYGKPVYVSTLLPQTTSSDSFQSVTGQTYSANSATFMAFNNGLRAGRIQGVAGYIDIEPVLCTATNSGYWIPTTNLNSMKITGDGTHPGTSGYIMLQNALPDFFAASTRPSLSVAGGSVNGNLIIQGILTLNSGVTLYNGGLTNLSGQPIVGNGGGLTNLNTTALVGNYSTNTTATLFAASNGIVDLQAVRNLNDSVAIFGTNLMYLSDMLFLDSMYNPNATPTNGISLMLRPYYKTNAPFSDWGMFFNSSTTPAGVTNSALELDNLTISNQWSLAIIFDTPNTLSQHSCPGGVPSYVAGCANSNTLSAAYLGLCPGNNLYVLSHSGNNSFYGDLGTNLLDPVTYYDGSFDRNYEYYHASETTEAIYSFSNGWVTVWINGFQSYCTYNSPIAPPIGVTNVGTLNCIRLGADIVSIPYNGAFGTYGDLPFCGRIFSVALFNRQTDTNFAAQVHQWNVKLQRDQTVWDFVGDSRWVAYADEATGYYSGGTNTFPYFAGTGKRNHLWHNWSLSGETLFSGLSKTNIIYGLPVPVGARHVQVEGKSINDIFNGANTATPTLWGYVAQMAGIAKSYNTDFYFQVPYVPGTNVTVGGWNNTTYFSNYVAFKNLVVSNLPAANIKLFRADVLVDQATININGYGQVTNSYDGAHLRKGTNSWTFGLKLAQLMDAGPYPTSQTLSGQWYLNGIQATNNAGFLQIYNANTNWSF